MGQTRIKICGVRDPDTASHALGSGADHIGVQFAEGSPRQVTIAEARHIVAAISSTKAQPIAVFSNQAREFIDEVLDNVGFEIIQLHGDEDRQFVESLSTVKVFKAVPFNQGKIDTWRDPPENVTALLIDAPTEPGELTGGTGRVFDWDALANLDRTDLPPIILAGGLTPGNVAQAVRTVRPFAVDVSSGVESSRGVKDHALIREFIQAVQSADKSLDE